MEDALTLIEEVFSSGGSCQSEDMEVGMRKDLFPSQGIQREVQRTEDQGRERWYGRRSWKSQDRHQSGEVLKARIKKFTVVNHYKFLNRQ